MWLPLRALVNLLLLVSSALAQSYQYSKGWTNGAQGKSSIIYDECMVMRTQAQLGQRLPEKYYSLCTKPSPLKSEFEGYLVDQNKFLLPDRF